MAAEKYDQTLIRLTSPNGNVVEMLEADALAVLWDLMEIFPTEVENFLKGLNRP